MNQTEICPREVCTGCGACANICPKQCISWVKDELDTIYPTIDEKVCVHCDACRKVCPNNNELAYRVPIRTYAAWSLDPENRRTSASGGIASEFYRYALERGGFTCGAELTLDKGVNFITVERKEDILRVKNSKYVFSHMNDIYKKVKQALQTGRFVYFVGLPCQVAGLKSYLGKNADSDNLLLADIIYHGVSNEDYLFQYVHHIERTLKRKTECLSFRDPYFGTEKYVFTLRSKSNPSGLKSMLSQRAVPSKPLYMQNHGGTNLYYIGYMNSLTYRENCYHCRYARAERISDLTFGDFDGLGSIRPFLHPPKQVSMCLVNTTKGLRYLNEIADQLFLEERTLEEAIKPQCQLKAPANYHPKRNLFVDEYRRSHDFTEAARKSLKKEVCRNRINQIKQVLIVRPLLKVTTKEQRDKIKRLLKH